MWDRLPFNRASAGESILHLERNVFRSERLSPEESECHRVSQRCILVGVSRVGSKESSFSSWRVEEVVQLTWELPSSRAYHLHCLSPEEGQYGRQKWRKCALQASKHISVQNQRELGEHAQESPFNSHHVRVQWGLTRNPGTSDSMSPRDLQATP